MRLRRLVGVRKKGGRSGGRDGVGWVRGDGFGESFCVLGQGLIGAREERTTGSVAFNLFAPEL